MVHKKVIIIGAGIAGLSAAKHFNDNGLDDFLVLEARDRIGGRIHTIQLENDRPLELGAQWIHGGSNANNVFELAFRYISSFFHMKMGPKAPSCI